MAVINGTSGNDILKDSFSHDEMNGLGGDDQLLGGRGNDTLNGGDGNDLLDGGTGDDTLRGDAGADFIMGGDGNDQLDGGTGADTLNGGDGSDTYFVDNVGDVVTESFDDDLSWYFETDSVLASVTYTLGFGLENITLTGLGAINGTGNEKNNFVSGNDSNNVLSGLAGDDTLSGGGGRDLLNGGDGADYMNGGDGNDHLIGGDGDDSLFGDFGNDRLDGGIGADSMNGDFGSDTYIVDNAGDRVNENYEVDGEIDTVLASVTHTLGTEIENLTLTGAAISNGTGNEKNNVIIGNGASNTLSGLDGNDQLNGGFGNDVLDGGSGDDLLIGGASADAFIGGLGADIFKYNSVNDSPAGVGRDVLIDFQGGAAIGDRIDLSLIDANDLVVGNQPFTYIGSAAFTAAGQLRYADGTLSGSTDADAAPEFQIQLLGGPALFVGGIGTDIIL